MKNESKILSKCESKLWTAKAEVESFSALFCALGPAELDGDALYGIGLALKRVKKRLAKVIDALGEVRGADDRAS